MTTQPTMRDVALRAGVSISTVSLALRGNTRIPVSTRKAVQRVAQELGYRANPILAALASHRWNRRPTPSGVTVALLADRNLEGKKGMVERASQYGYTTEVFQLKDYPDPRRLSQILYSRGILGVVVGQIFTRGFCEAFDWSCFTSVACCLGSERPPVNLVMPNHFLAVQEGWDHARALGYRRIGLLTFEDPMALDCYERRAAFMERQSGVPEKDRVPILVWPTDANGRKGAMAEEQRAQRIEMLQQWMRTYRPDVVMGFNITCYWFLKDAGWSIPQQVAFISLWMEGADRETSGMILSIDEAGSRAVDWLDLLMRTGERGVPAHPATMSVDMVWQHGKTAPGAGVRKGAGGV